MTSVPLTRVLTPVTREEAHETRTLSLTFPRRNALHALLSHGRDKG